MSYNYADKVIKEIIRCETCGITINTSEVRVHREHVIKDINDKLIILKKCGCFCVSLPNTKCDCCNTGDRVSVALYIQCNGHKKQRDEGYEDVLNTIMVLARDEFEKIKESIGV